jgi:alkylation response protein AidB-like acyl-CoA dehydrogenase
MLSKNREQPMGTVSQFHDRTRPAARRIESEEEAIATARSLSAAFAVQSSERDINRILPYAELDALSQSGLTAITVPPEYEGLDVANALLGEIVAIIAEGDSSIAECLELHFRVLEELRIQASEELKSALFARALAGERFTTAAFAARGAIVASGLGFRLDGRSAPSPGILFADWVVVQAISTEGAGMTLYLPRDTEGLQFLDDWDGFGQRTNGTGTVIASEIPLTTDSAVIGPQRDPSTASALGALLHAGTDLGIARAALANLHGSTVHLPCRQACRRCRMCRIPGRARRRQAGLRAGQSLGAGDRNRVLFRICRKDHRKRCGRGNRQRAVRAVQQQCDKHRPES